MGKEKERKNKIENVNESVRLWDNDERGIYFTQ